MKRYTKEMLLTELKALPYLYRVTGTDKGDLFRAEQNAGKNVDLDVSILRNRVELQFNEDVVWISGEIEIFGGLVLDTLDFLWFFCFRDE